MHSHFDLLNAIEFAHHGALEHQYEYFLKKYPHIFKYVEVRSRQATHEDYYVPASIAQECKVYSVNFNETGCRKVGCFPKTNALKDCSAKDATRYVTIGSKFFLSCQPACQEISRSVDTEFQNGRCLQVNTEKKIFALFPEKIHGVQTYQPMHDGLELRNGDLFLNPDYCTAFGLEFENDGCVTPIGQEIGEFFLGSTVYKTFKKCSVPRKPKPVPPPIPGDVKNMDQWLEGSQRVQKSSDFIAKTSLPVLPKEPFSVILQNLVKDIALDYTVDFSIQKTLDVLKKRIPHYLTKVSTTAVSSKIIQSSLMKAVTQSSLLTLANVSKGLFSTLSKVNVVMSLFGTISSIVDIFDPFHYNYVLEKETLSKVNTLLDFTFYRSNNRTVEITPEKIMHILEDSMDIYTGKLNEQIDYYMHQIELEDFDERFKIQQKIAQKHKPKKQYHWHSILHVLFVTVLILVSLLFIKYLAYFILLYFVVIFFYPPSFY